MKIFDGDPVGKVVDLKAVREPSIMRKPRDLRACKHDGRLVVSERDRTVQCSKCEVFVDPIEALLDMSRHWDRYLNAIERFKAEMQRRAASLEELKREERNAKARARRRGAA